MLDVPRVLNRISLQIDHQVTQQNAGFIGGPGRFYVNHQQAAIRRRLAPQGLGHRHRLHRETQIRFGDVSFFEEFIDRAIHGGERDGHSTSAG